MRSEEGGARKKIPYKIHGMVSLGCGETIKLAEHRDHICF